MGKSPCCSKVGLHKGPLTAKEDELLTNYVESHGEGHWRSLPNKAVLLRCGKSCRLRWMKYLRSDIKRGDITQDEDDIIIRMHALLGNRWSLIASWLPGRTNNEIKNYWNSHLRKKLNHQGIHPTNHKKLPPSINFPSFKDCKGKKPKMGKFSKGEKVVKPKSIRFTYPLSDHFMTTDSSLWVENGKFAEVAWSDDNSISANCIGSDQYHQQKTTSLTNDERTLEKVYEEYLQLLNTDGNVDHEADQLNSKLK